MPILTWFALFAGVMSFFVMTAKVLAVTKAQGRLDRELVRMELEPSVPAPVEPDVRPLYELISRCPECGVVAAHLLMELTARVASRKCVECDHEWHERVA